MNRLHILINGEHLGVLEGAGKRLRLTYDTDLDPAAIPPVSLSMPISGRSYRGEHMTNWISALLPDREPVLMRWRRDFGVSDLRPESLLAHVGEDVAGACQFVRDDRLEAVMHRRRSLVRLSEDDIAGLAVAAKQDSLPYDPGTSTGRFSLAGAQAKFALQRLPDGGWALPEGAEPSTHIFKPAIPGLEDQDATEVVSMRTAAVLGLPVAPTVLAQFAGQRMIVVERYDRQFVDGQWWRVHQEDLCQAGGWRPRAKYESQGGPGAVQCAAIIGQHCGSQDVERFVDALLFNHLIKGSDAHARNYSVLLTAGEARLAPLYDLNTTLGFGTAVEAQRSAMMIAGQNRFTTIGVGHWRLLAAQVGLDEDQVVHRLREMARDLPDAVAEACSDGDLAGVAATTLDRLKARAGKWCSEAVRDRASAATANSPVRRKTTPRSTSGSFAEQVRSDPGPNVV